MGRRQLLTLLMVALVPLIGIASAEPAEPSPEQIEALGQIRSFDVYYAVDTTVQPKQADAQLIHTTTYLRFVMDTSGRQRVERYESKGGPLTEFGVYDGKAFYYLNVRANQLVIQPRNVDSDPILKYGESYRELLDGLFGGGDFRELIPKRSGAKASESEDGVVIDIPAEPGEMYPKFGWRVFLDPKRNLVSSRRERYFENSETLVQTTDIPTFDELEDGKFAPVEAVLEYFGANGRKFQTIKIAVDRERSAWNHEPGDGVFRLAIPKGVVVHDDIRGLRYKASMNGDLNRLDEMARKGIQKIDTTVRPAVPLKKWPKE